MWPFLRTKRKRLGVHAGLIRSNQHAGGIRQTFIRIKFQAHHRRTCQLNRTECFGSFWSHLGEQARSRRRRGRYNHAVIWLGIPRDRSEERRVGKECRCGWAPEARRKKSTNTEGAQRVLKSIE